MKKQMHYRAQSHQRRGAARGVALIEALVAILIFAVGVLGLVGLQVSMTRAQGAGKYRADAANLASEVIGLMWVDKALLSGGNLTSYATANCAAYTPCNDWKNKVASTLPAGTAAISAATDGNVTVTLTWTIPNEGSHTYATSTVVLVN
jgi:type IV pilus assembly protein PilV